MLIHIGTAKSSSSVSFSDSVMSSSSSQTHTENFACCCTGDLAQQLILTVSWSGGSQKFGLLLCRLYPPDTETCQGYDHGNCVYFGHDEAWTWQAQANIGGSFDIDLKCIRTHVILNLSLSLSRAPTCGSLCYITGQIEWDFAAPIPCHFDLSSGLGGFGSAMACGPECDWTATSFTINLKAH
jgi:hypothetical protein